MFQLNPRRVGAAVAVTGAALALAVPATAAPSPGTATGPSSSDSPYLVRTAAGVVTKSILTVGDTPTGSSYRMAGLPDGLGAWDNGDGTFSVVMNHELGSTAGVERAHGAKGAFVSRWVVDKETLEVLAGQDLIQTVDGVKGVALNRLCSADLASPAAYYNPATGLGYDAGRIFTNGEETSGGRAFAHVASGPDAGQSFTLPHLGRLGFENVVSRPVASDWTVTVGTDDSTPGQVYVHVGRKQATGTPAQRAGLVGGNLFGVALEGLAAEDATAGSAIGDGYRAPFTGKNLGDVSAKSGGELEAASDAAGVTRFARPEDGAWSADGSSFYFVTTAAFTQHSRLWRLDFVDPTDPAKGGTARVLLEGPASGTDGPKMMDNITVNDRGQVLIQEDPGGQGHLAAVWQYDPATDTARKVAEHDPARFVPGAPEFMTIDEESSGIIPAPFLGAGWYLADVQAHARHADPELVEHGQLLAIHIPPGRPVR